MRVCVSFVLFWMHDCRLDGLRCQTDVPSTILCPRLSCSVNITVWFNSDICRIFCQEILKKRRIVLRIWSSNILCKPYVQDNEHLSLDKTLLSILFLFFLDSDDFSDLFAFGLYQGVFNYAVGLTKVLNYCRIITVHSIANFMTFVKRINHWSSCLILCVYLDQIKYYTESMLAAQYFNVIHARYAILVVM